MMKVIVAVLVACSTGTWRDEQPTTRAINVTVTVLGGDGQPVSGLPVSAGLAATGMWAKTGSSGQAVLTGDVALAAESVWVLITPSSKGSTLQEVRADGQQYEEVVKTSAFRTYYRVELQPNVSDYVLEIAATPASTLTGRTVDGQGGPVWTIICAIDGPEIASSDTNTGEFALDGISKLAANELYATDIQTGRVMTRVVTQVEASAGGGIGDLVFSLPINPATVSIQTSNAAALTWKPVRRDNEVTLIKTSGEMWVFPIATDGKLVTRIRSSQSPKVPEGTYYIAPGRVGRSRTAQTLLQAIRNARFTELDSAGVPKVVVSTGGGTGTVDLAAAEAAIYTLGGPP